MNYAKFFQSILLEQDLPSPNRPQHAQTPDAISTMLDQDTDADEFVSTDGIETIIREIEGKFERKLNLLSGIDRMPSDKRDKKLKELEEYLDKLRLFVDSKDGVDMKNEYSIMANIIKNDILKKGHFDKIIDRIEAYKESVRKQREQSELDAKDLAERAKELVKVKQSISPDLTEPDAPVPLSVGNSL
jgi:transcriptional regulator of aromatic amino acid metabolism